MKIARVFPKQTSMSPVDNDAYFGPPDLFTPQYDEVHISVVFTWDVVYAQFLRTQWKHIAPVKIGGPAITGEGKEFVPGMYVREGVTITSRGCPSLCPWCFVRSPLQELLTIHPGSNVIDNNILACSDGHIDRVFAMLRSQRRIKFSGGLEPGRITDKMVERIRGLSIRQLYLAYDREDAFATVKKAFEILNRYFTRDYLGCYVLIGFEDDTMDRAENRLRQILDLGGLPFAMLYRNKAGEYPQPEMEWRRFQRSWLRPAYVRFKLKEMRAEL